MLSTSSLATLKTTVFEFICDFDDWISIPGSSRFLWVKAKFCISFSVVAYSYLNIHVWNGSQWNPQSVRLTQLVFESGRSDTINESPIASENIGRFEQENPWWTFSRYRINTFIHLVKQSEQQEQQTKLAPPNNLNWLPWVSNAFCTSNNVHRNLVRIYCYNLKLKMVTFCYSFCAHRINFLFSFLLRHFHRRIFHHSFHRYYRSCRQWWFDASQPF